MRDIFYTILIVWIVWRIYVSFSRRKQYQNQSPQQHYAKREGETTIEHIPNKNKKPNINDGEYVDYEEVK